MKAWLCFGFLFCLATAHSQNHSVLTQQLGALQELLRTTKTGYEWVETRLRQVGQITGGELQLHTGFIDGMDSVSRGVSGDARLAGLKQRQTDLIFQLQTDLAYWRKQRFVHP